MRSIDETCNDIHALLTYQRKLIDIEVTRETPVRLKLTMELTSPKTPTVKANFTAEGMLCDHGFDRTTAEALCRSKGKKLQMFGTGYEWTPNANELNDKCYFDYKGDPFIVPCDFVLENFKCNSDTPTLADCIYSPLFQHSCTKDNHIGISCSGKCNEFLNDRSLQF